ncbi:MAG TPA: response regulator transcription factor [Burkholderiales bacterium]|nr:response regulator transcription factor [Burkholderiales bacterium]
MRILVVDDHALFREGLKFLLRDLDDELVISEAADCRQAVAQQGQAFDLILLDLHMPGVEGLDALDALRGAFEGTRIVVLSAEEDPRQVRRAIDSGAAGFIPKASTPEVLLNALRLILAGGIYLPPMALRGLADAPEPIPSIPASHDRVVEALSGRQLDVLNKAVLGKPNKVIARELGISEATVKAHLSAAFRVLGVRNRTEAVYTAARLGLRIGRA